MPTIDKDKIDLDTTIVEVKLIVRGNRSILKINCTARQAIEFVDYLNENRGIIRNKTDKEKFENKFYIFDDIIHKKTVGVSLKDVKYLEIPYFIDKKDKFDIKILTVN